jgi:hypothetical protein
MKAAFFALDAIADDCASGSRCYEAPIVVSVWWRRTSFEREFQGSGTPVGIALWNILLH